MTSETPSWAPSSQLTARWRWIAHPFIFAIFPILSMLSNNLGQVRLSETLLPIAIVLICTPLAQCVFLLLFHDRGKTGLFVSGLWLSFFFYGTVFDFISSVILAQGSFSEIWARVAWALVFLVFIGLVLLLRATRRDLGSVTAFLNLASVAALLIAAFPLVRATLHRQQPVLPTPSFSVKAAFQTPGGALPDIYYVILDSYGRADYLKETFQFDNEPFLEELQKRGFYIADQCRSNYSITVLSLPSSLNMNFLRNLIPGTEDDSTLPRPLLAKLLQENLAMRSLKEHGYSIAAFSSGMTFSEIYWADDYLKPQWTPTSFQEVLIGATPLRHLRAQTMERGAADRWDPVHKEMRVPYILDNLDQAKRGTQPVFVFAHVYSPHPPHCFDSNGVVLATPPAYKKGYIDEVKYLNAKLLVAVDKIIAKNPNSVIVLQGDHGPWRYSFERVLDWEGTREQVVRDRTENLNVYRLPNIDSAAVLYPTISPVNTFRVILNTYLGANLELLPDDSCVNESEFTPSFWIASDEYRGSSVQ